MKRHLESILCILLLAVLVLGGCTKARTYRIGVSQCSDDAWRTKMNDEIRREVLFHPNVEVEIRSADDSNERQVNDLRYFASNGFDIIIAAPNESHALTPIVDSIYAAGIPVILFDRDIESENYTAFQGADNHKIGRDAADYILSRQERPRVIEIRGLLDCTPADDRHGGFAEVAESDDRLAILGTANGNWTRSGAAALTDSMLRLYPEATAVYAHNDWMAMGAREVCDSLGLTDMLIVGIDAAPGIGLEATHEGLIDATFIYPTEGGQLIRTALSILHGLPYERNLILPALSAVDANNVEILLNQNQLLESETRKVNELNDRIDTVYKQHSAQTQTLYAVIIILVLCAGIIFVLLRTYWIQKRSKTQIEAQKEQIQAQRDEINEALQQLQQATQSKLTFFTNVSHDLRTPLTLISDPVRLLSESPNLNAEEQTLVRLASKNIKILMRLINQILDFRKYENGKLDLALAEVNMAAQLSDWTEAFRQTAIRRHQHFRVELPSDLADYSIAVDVEKIERVLFNLLSNAFKFTPENGTIVVRLTRDAANMYLTVTDNGKGINAEDLQHVFERFFKADKVHPEGSGIGLALSRAFVELHGGSVKVESEVGRGTRFTVALPVRHVEAQEPRPQHTEIQAPTEELANVETENLEPDENRDTVLVIDDNADICTFVKTLLGSKYTVLQAPDGFAGIKLATKHVPNLIICDMMMPGIDGFETCKRLKGDVATSHIPVLMLTACALDEQRIEGYHSGADAYLTKPFNSEVLLARCEALIANRHRLEQSLLAKIDYAVPEPAADGREPAAADLDNDFYRRFAETVKPRLADPDLTIEDVADELGLSRVQLYRKIKSLTNYSPVELIRNLRLQRASHMLKTTESTVSEVCYAVGFTSPSYFSKCFREYFGETPGDLQKRAAGR